MQTMIAIDKKRTNLFLCEKASYTVSYFRAKREGFYSLLEWDT